MGFSVNGKLQRAAYNGKLLKGAAYNGKIVYGIESKPVGVPATAKTASYQLFNFTNTGGVIAMDAAQLPETNLAMKDPAHRYSLKLALSIQIQLTGTVYSLALGAISDAVPITVKPITLDNTTYSLSGVHTVYVAIEGTLWAAINMNGRGDLEAVSSDVPGAQQAAEGDLYQKATELRDRITVYSGPIAANPTATPTPVLPVDAKFKALYDALVAKIADGTTDLLKVEIYWN